MRETARSVIVVLLFVGTPEGAAAAASQPTLNLFPAQVVDAIHETSVNAKSLEDSLADYVTHLDQQMQLYADSKCEGSVRDQGCQQLSRQMASTYHDMLQIMADKLPAMRHHIEITRHALRARIATELGTNRTGSELQQLLRSERHGTTDALRTRRHSSGMRLSDRFRDYYALVNQGSKGSLALISSQLYLDLQETAQLAALTEEQVQRGMVLSNLTESFGSIAPGMQETVNGVKRILFGQEDPASSDEAAPASQHASGPTRFCSEFDANC